MPFHNGWLPREGFTADPVLSLVNKTVLNPVLLLPVLLLARKSGLLRLGMVSIDGTKIDANATKIRSVRYDRAQELRAKLAADIAALTARPDGPP